MEQIEYPDGDTEHQERFKYVYINFKIISMGSERFLLQLINPPVSIKSFIPYLSMSIVDLFIEKYKFNVTSFHKNLTNINDVSKVKVRSLKASSLRFSDKSAAKIELFSEFDALRELI